MSARRKGESDLEFVGRVRENQYLLWTDAMLDETFGDITKMVDQLWAARRGLDHLDISAARRAKLTAFFDRAIPKHEADLLKLAEARRERMGVGLQ